MRSWISLVVLILISVSSYWVYLSVRTPPGLEPMGGDEAMIAKLSFWTAVLSALAAFLSILKEVIGFFKNGSGK